MDITQATVDAASGDLILGPCWRHSLQQDEDCPNEGIRLKWNDGARGKVNSASIIRPSSPHESVVWNSADSRSSTFNRKRNDLREPSEQHDLPSMPRTVDSPGPTFYGLCTPVP